MDPRADLAAGPRGLDDRQPVAARTVGGGGEDLYDVPVLERCPQRDDPPVDAGADAAVADVRVDGVSEVDRSSPAREGEDPSLRRERIDRLGIEVHPHQLPDLVRALYVVLRLQQLP